MIVGGGDSALDWTLGLQDTAKTPIGLVHRRDNFRALESSVSEARSLEGEGRVRIFTPCEVRELHGDGSLESVSIENTKTGEVEQVAVRGADHAARLPLAPRRDRRLGPRAARQAPAPDRPDDLRDDAPGRLRRGRRRRLRGQDHADHDRHGRGRDRREQRGRPDPRREGPAEVLDRLGSEERLARSRRSFEPSALAARADPGSEMPSLRIECLRCGDVRVLHPDSHHRLDGGECTRCSYVGWAASLRARRDAPPPACASGRSSGAGSTPPE